MAQAGRNFLKDEGGAVAPLYALSLTALIAIGGIAFDYSRLASMDTELQNAADQAALAAASQLDGAAGATQRAEEAARELVANQTRFSNDGAAARRGVEIAEVTFYSCETNACLDDRIGANMTLVERDDGATDDDAAARYVGVRVAGRRAFYALTPIVNAVSSGDMAAGALAGMGSSICRVPPVMMCNPDETGDAAFTTENYIGAGIRLVANDGGGGYGPGNFGFLANDAGNGANTLRMALGRVAPPGDCVRYDGVTTEPGAMVSVLDALNTRFGVYANGLNSACGTNDALCPASANTRKDVRLGGAGNSLAFQPGNGNTGWKLPDGGQIDTRLYPPAALTTTRTLTTGEINQLWPMGHPRDICHATSTTGNCSGGRIGNGVWDRNAYFRSNSTNYPSVPTNSDLTNWFGTTTPTRYQVYRWELDNAASRLQPQATGNGANGRTSYGQPVGGGGLVPGANTVDRRRLSVAVINCEAEGISGRTTNVKVTKWIEVFLVEPTIPRPRTENSDLYVEVISETQAGEGQTAGQVVRRDIPYLVE